MSHDQVETRDISPMPGIVLEACIAATAAAMEELCQCPVMPGEVSTSSRVSMPDAIAGLITLRRSVPGSLIFACPGDVGRSLAERYLPPGEPLAEDLLADVMGEFTNVIAGQMKTILQGTPYHFHLSTPQLGRYGDLSGAINRMVIPFTCEYGGFAVFLDLAPCADA